MKYCVKKYLFANPLQNKKNIEHSISTRTDFMDEQ